MLLRGATLKNTEYVYGNVNSNTGVGSYQSISDDIDGYWVLFWNSGGHLHWHGNQDGPELPVQVPEAVSCGEVSLAQHALSSINTYSDIPLSPPPPPATTNNSLLCISASRTTLLLHRVSLLLAGLASLHLPLTCAFLPRWPVVAGPGCRMVD